MSSFVHAMIPVAIGATFIVLCIGIYALFRGGRFNRSYSNLLMRWRILLQFIAICLIALAGLALGSNAMVKLDKIYTRGGDKGQTSLVDGSRVAKHDLRVAAYGTADEANAALGLARLHTRQLPELDAMIGRIQNDLFDLGADLATPEQEAPKWEPLRIVQAQVDRLEAEIDAMNANIPPLQSFILPGGSPAAAYLHLARTLSRRAERLAVELAEREAINPIVVKYLNRLSDHLFVAARHANNNGADDVLWVPGQNR